MGKRVTFTKRELQKLSKTHEGRQHINSTYIREGKKFVAVGIVYIIFIVIFTAVLYQYASLLPLLGSFLGVVFIIIGAVQISNSSQAYQTEEKNERSRIRDEQEYQRRVREQEIAAQKERAEYIRRLRQSNIEKIDCMEGFEFEEYVAALLSDLGYETSTTKKSGDFGVDIIVERNGEKIIIQTKRYSQKVSVSAIQEISAAQSFYRIYNAWVVTNNYFTEPAIKLAKANNINLVNRDALISLMLQAQEESAQSVETETQSAFLELHYKKAQNN